MQGANPLPGELSRDTSVNGEALFVLLKGPEMEPDKCCSFAVYQ